MASRDRPLGLRLIVAYKFVKAPISLAIAAALTFAPVPSDHLLHHLASQLSEWGIAGWRIANWLWPRLTPGMEIKVALIAWLDGAATLLEGILLASGKVWGEWLVVGGLALLLPLEAIGTVRRPSVGHVAILVINALVVAYLVHRRLATHAMTAGRDAP